MSSDSEPWKSDWLEHDEVSRGGQGIVTKLRLISEPTRRAVLKRLLPRWQGDSQAKERLQHEGEILARLHALGAKVPEVIDSSERHAQSEPFLLMEFISGTRFDHWLKSKAPVKTQQGVTITRSISETIELCHTHSIGHRDLKPANIILKDDDTFKPHILGFGISFDSQQTIILTREGEMFRNEFIILPECQDLEGGHRDLRSDITALVGVFFSCLTGKPPIVLRDATGRAPHQRHETLVAAGASNVSEGERLMWFFQKGFAYNLSDRFQSMSEFIGELMKFADVAAEADLDPIEQFKILNHNVQSTDRKVQLIALTRKYNSIWPSIQNALAAKLDPIKKHAGSYGNGSFSLTQWHQAKLPKGEYLETGSAHSFTVSRNHFDGVALALLIGLAVGMDIHLYAASLTHPQAKNALLEWSKVVVIEDAQKKISDRTLAVVVDALAKKLAHEIRNLNLKREQK